jgi:hypothetical protein
MRDARDRMGKHAATAAQELRECQDHCLACIQHCLRSGGMHAEARHIRTLFDCSALCDAAAGFLARQSDFHPRVCAVCAEQCDLCAASCERIKDDEEMRACALVCRRCAETCRALSGTA